MKTVPAAWAERPLWVQLGDLRADAGQEADALKAAVCTWSEDQEIIDETIRDATETA
jgi:hypothetical protein